MTSCSARSKEWSSSVRGHACGHRSALRQSSPPGGCRCWPLALAVLVLLPACPSAPPPRDPTSCKPAPIEVFLQADAILNRNELGQSQPVEVRVLLLRERERLEQADFETVWKDAASLLGKDLVTEASLTVFPGKLKIYPMKSAPGVSYVALVGLFRRPEGHGWRHVVDVRQTNQRCAANEELHSIVHALLRENRIVQPN